MTTADGSVIEGAGTRAGGGGAGASSTLARRRPSLAALARRAWAALGEEVRAQAVRWMLWLPVAFGGGCAVYFGLKSEPAAWIGWGSGGVALAVAAMAWRTAARPAASIALALAAVGLLGFADAKLVTEQARAPVIPDGLGVAQVTGRVVDIAETAGGRLRLLLQPVAISGLAPAALPVRVRITLREPTDVEPGDGLTVHAILDPPPGPASPGGFDFARDAWFSRLGGVGLALSPPRPVSLPPMDWRLWAQVRLNTLRWRLASRLANNLGGGDAAGLAAAVTTSHQAWLSEADAQDLRNSGLAHMLAIAGLHTAAVTGFVYAAVRLLVAAWPWLALRVSGKKLAAGAGLVACVVYLALSGAHPPARRAAITASVAFLAMLCGRRPISMRSLAVAALAVLALQPISVVQPGFQMSFCATAALVAMAEAWPRRSGKIEAPWFIAWPQHAWDWAVAMAAVSLVAGLATAPFALQHFNRMATYGLFANLAADLVASLVLMPSVVVCAAGAAAGIPPGWMGAPQAVASVAAQAILAIAHLFATLPGAVRTLPSAPQPALVTAFVALVFACLWRGRLRWLAAPLSAAVLVWPRPPAPVAWVAEDGDNAAVVEDGRAVVLKPAVRGFASNAWTTRRGLLTPFDSQSEAELAFDCDRSACSPRDGVSPALGAWWSRRPAPADRLAALCQASDILVVRGPAPAPDLCPHALMLTQIDFQRGGSAEIYADPRGWRVAWAQTERGLRPWSLPPAMPERPIPSKRGTGPSATERPAISDSGG
ncbi:ComEC/Rec2 family competence protein [Caulobacter sp. S45]|uniref:ComEC/Rec2 family competence protein n=1 Tax=Caulobacter sp. S45 TaxID=1641861 RepID=UPI0020C5F36F|nr:ComEC/Rec2 family competence protein [Caulobacter sp. S45]